MIRLNRATEYALIALRHMSRKAYQEPKGLTSAREVADSYGLPFEITAKTLQKLKEQGLIQSSQGAKGGYTLRRPLREVTLGEFLTLMEGPQSVVACSGQTEPADPCEYKAKCEISGMMSKLNAKVTQFLSAIRLSELAEGQSFDPALIPVQMSEQMQKAAAPALPALFQEP